MREKRGRLRAGAFTLLLIVAGSAGTVTADESASPKAPAASTPTARADGQVGPAPQVVEVEPVPEPSTGLLLCAAGVVALARRRKRAARQSD